MECVVDALKADCPVMCRGAQPFLMEACDIRAPIRESGSMIRFMGRFWMDSSPVRVTSKFWADRIPDIRRVVVPLLPQSRTVPGLLKSLQAVVRGPGRGLRLFSMSTPILLEAGDGGETVRSLEKMAEFPSFPWQWSRT